MRNFKIAAAVAGVLASASASAANYDIYISGASAQRAFWTGKYLQSLCGGAAGVSQFDSNGNRTTDGVAIETFSARTTNNGLLPGASPDIKAFRCTGTAAGSIGAGNVLTIHYSAELGSVWGVLPALYASGHTQRGANSATRLFIEPGTGTSCGATSSNASTGSTLFGTSRNCPGTAAGSYYSGEDAILPDAAGLFQRKTPDIVVTDIEPSKWVYTDNWPAASTLNWFAGSGTSIFGSAPTPDEIQDVLGLGYNGNGLLIGQVFAVAVSTNAGNAFTMPTSLSKTSISSIFTGAVKQWSALPELQGVSGTNANIYVCRRDHGSGTQVAASIAFVGTECGLSNTGSHAFVSASSKGNIVTVNERPTGGEMANCLRDNPNSIGILSLAPSSSYNVLAVDGVQPNAHNGAAGVYPYAFETWGARLTTGSGNAAKADQIIGDLLLNGTLQDAVGGETGSWDSSGHFVVTGGVNGVTSSKPYFSLQAGNTVSVANLRTSGILPVAGFDRAGESCSVPAFNF